MGGHWDHLYRTRGSDQLSWTQAAPTMSLRLIEQLPIGREDAIVDVGAGESTLVDDLLAGISPPDRSRRSTPRPGPCPRPPHRRRTVDGRRDDQVGSRGRLTWRPAQRYRLWHDRAVFHFLTEPADRETYRDLAASTVAPGGFLIVATFALDGPTHCSGLPVMRYGPAELTAAFAPHFATHLVDDEQHHTPWGAVQHFTWLVLQRGP